MPELLIAGCGYVGSALGAGAARLLGAPWRLWGLRRQPTSLPPGVTPIAADLLDPELASRLPPVRFDAVALAVAAKHSSPEAYERTYVQAAGNLLAALRQRGDPLRRLVFTSSTAVYHQDDGAWVNEDSPTQPNNFRGKCLLRAEQQLLESGVPSVILRLGGIYGPGRTRLLDSARQADAAAPPGGPEYGNRIHRDDCAAALAHLVNFIRLPSPASHYLGVDHEPADRHAVLQFLRQCQGLPALAPAGSGPPTGKRCDSTRLRQSGLTFAYPTYREGYAALLTTPAASPPEADR